MHRNRVNNHGKPPLGFLLFHSNTRKGKIMKKLVLLGMCVLFSLHAWAQSSLSGRIYDAKTTAPLVGASVWIESLGKGAVTDIDGNFTFARVPNGKQEIRVSYLGYETVRKSVEVPLVVSLEFGLEFKDFLSEVSSIGSNVTIVNKDHVDEADRPELGFYIRNGIVVVVKNASIPDGTVI